ncbi:hypothetical protein RU09_12140 [Microbacterium sp. MEJ108Y]|nr:hypothetical protein RU09_12140 [Microbacterium sp. MEJ108Y]
MRNRERSRRCHRSLLSRAELPRLVQLVHTQPVAAAGAFDHEPQPRQEAHNALHRGLGIADRSGDRLVTHSDVAAGAAVGGRRPDTARAQHGRAAGDAQPATQRLDLGHAQRCLDGVQPMIGPARRDARVDALHWL